MSHYADCYDEEDQRSLERTRDEIKRELDTIESKSEMYRIQKLIRNREKISTFFSILKDGIL